MHCGVKDSILSDDVYNGELLTMLKFVQMAVPLGAKVLEFYFVYSTQLGHTQML